MVVLKKNARFSATNKRAYKGFTGNKSVTEPGGLKHDLHLNQKKFTKLKSFSPFGVATRTNQH